MLNLEVQAYSSTIWNQFLQYLQHIWEACLAFFMPISPLSPDMAPEADVLDATIIIDLAQAEEDVAEEDAAAQSLFQEPHVNGNHEKEALEIPLIETNQNAIQNLIQNIQWDKKLAAIALVQLPAVLGLIYWLLKVSNNQQEDEFTSVPYAGFH